MILSYKQEYIHSKHSATRVETWCRCSWLLEIIICIVNKVEINFVCFMLLQVVGSNVQILKEVSCNFTPCWTLDTSNKIILSLREENISMQFHVYWSVPTKHRVNLNSWRWEEYEKWAREWPFKCKKERDESRLGLTIVKTSSNDHLSLNHKFLTSDLCAPLI